MSVDVYLGVCACVYMHVVALIKFETTINHKVPSVSPQYWSI